MGNHKKLIRAKPKSIISIPTPMHKALKAYASSNNLLLQEAIEHLLRQGMLVEYLKTKQKQENQ